MRVTVLILLVIKITAAEESESKYIDLLPEKEKEDFLEKIARRIHEEVDSIDATPKASIELSESQLNAHDEYVHKVLVEETNNLRKRANDSLKNSDVLLPDKQGVRTNPDDLDRYVDLTLRSEKRNKRESRKVFSKYSEDNEDNANNDSEKGSDSDVDIQVKNFKKLIENAESASQNPESTTDIADNISESETTDKTKVEPEETTDAILNTEDNAAVKNDEKLSVRNSDNKSLQNRSESHAIDTTSQGNLAVENDDKITAEDGNNKLAKNQSESNSTDTTLHDNLNTTNDVVLSSVEATNHSQNVNIRVSRSYDEDLEFNKENSNLGNDDKMKTANATSELKDSKVIHIDIASTTSRVETTSPDVKKLTENVDITHKEYTNADKNPTIEVTTTKVEVLTTTASPIKDSSESTIKKTSKQTFDSEIDAQNKYRIDVKNYLENNKNNDETHAKLSNEHVNLATELISILRQNFLGGGPKNKEIVFFDDLKSQFNKNKIKKHTVYEISPDADPFVKQKTLKPNGKKQAPDADAFVKQNNLKPRGKKLGIPVKEVTYNEQPYYVPIYNYSPDNAFYNPHNIFGPNTDSENEKSYISVTKTNIKDDEKDDYFISEDYAKDTLGNDKVTSPTSSNKVYTYRIGNNDKNRYTYGNSDKSENAKKNFEWDYYFYNDQLREYKYGANGPNDEASELEYKVSVGVNKPKFTETSIKSNDYLDVDYYLGRSNKMNLKWGRMGIIKECDRKCGFRPSSCKKKCLAEEESKKKEEEEVTKKPCESKEIETTTIKEEHVNEDAIRKIRKIFLEKKYYSLHKPIQDVVNVEVPDSNEDEAVKPNKTDLRFVGSNFYDNDKGGYHFGRQRAYIKKSHDYYIKHRKHDYQEIEKNNTIDYDLIKKIIDMVPDDSIVPTLLKLEQMDIQKAARSRKRSIDLDVFVTVLGDMIKENNRALVQYAWLETSVELQSAIKKMIDMTEAVSKGENIHPSDLELLQYVVFLYDLAKEELNGVREDILEKINELRAVLLPRNRNKKKRRITESGLLHRAWLFRMDEKHPIPDGVLDEFDQFLGDLQTGLFDLHTALKYIAMVATYKHQPWFQNLKELHIDSKRRELLEIILHLSTTRLLGLVEQSAKNGLEDDYLDYVRKNLKEVARTKDEFVFVLKVIEELKAIK